MSHREKLIGRLRLATMTLSDKVTAQWYRARAAEARAEADRYVRMPGMEELCRDRVDDADIFERVATAWGRLPPGG